MGITQDKAPKRQEVDDNVGSTVVYSGTATTTPANVPAVAGNGISGVGIDNYGNQDLLVSFDSGTTFKTLVKGDFYSVNIKGLPTQLSIKTLTGTADYEIMINFEDT